MAAPTAGMPPKPPMAAGAPPSVAPGGPAGAPPFGNSGATQPVPNAGLEAAVLQRIPMLAKMINDLVQQLGPTSETGSKLLKVVSDLAKIAPAGNTSNASERNMLEQAMMRNTQQGAIAQQMKQGAPGGQGAAPGGQA